MKHCPKCDEVKDKSEFSRNKCTKDGLQGYCKPCSKLIRNKEKIKEYYFKNIEYFKQKNKENWLNRDPELYNQNRIKYREENPERRMLTSAKERAKNKNLDFNLELSDIYIPEFCPYLEIPLFKGTKTVRKNSPSLDRIDSSLGYVKGNIQVISNLANTMKNNATREELIIFCTNTLMSLYDDEGEKCVFYEESSTLE